MFLPLKILVVFAFFHAVSANAVLRLCHKWLLAAPLAISDVEAGSQTLVVTQDGVLELRHSVTGEPLRLPIALGPETLRHRFHPIAAQFSADASVVSVEYQGLGVQSYSTSSGLSIASSPR